MKIKIGLINNGSFITETSLGSFEDVVDQLYELLNEEKTHNELGELRYISGDPCVKIGDALFNPSLIAYMQVHDKHTSPPEKPKIADPRIV